MRIFSLRTLMLTALALCITAPAVVAARPRPWVCRDKAVFSSDLPMVYEATVRKGHKWHLFFMHFDMGGPNEGFSTVSVRDLPRKGGTVRGHLPAGRYYAVALYSNASGYWLCPANVRENDAQKLGLIATLCFGESTGSCPVKVTIKPDHITTAPEPSP